VLFHEVLTEGIFGGTWLGQLLFQIMEKTLSQIYLTVTPDLLKQKQYAGQNLLNCLIIK